MRILPRNRQCESSRRGTWGGWAASELRLCAHLRLRKHDRPHRQKGPGARCDSRQLTRPTGEQEAAWNRRRRDQTADCWRRGPSVSGSTLPLGLYLSGAPHLCRNHPHQGTAQLTLQRGAIGGANGSPTTGICSPSDKGDDQISPSLGVVTQHVL